MLPIDPRRAAAKLVDFQSRVRARILALHGRDLSAVAHASDADTIYAIDAEIDPILVEFCEEWSREVPLVLVAEGMTDERGVEGPRTFPAGAADAPLRLIVDPIDGTRGLMYDKRPAWCLAGLAPNKGDHTRLSDVEVAAMTELPTSKQGRCDVLWAVRGQGAHAERVNVWDGRATPFVPRPSGAATIGHGFASVSNFFPGTKRLAAELMERIALAQIGEADVTRATVFDDQYISSGGQLYELIVGHDRFVCDLRSEFYRMQGQPEGLCVHPYDVCTQLVAQECGVIVTDARGAPLDGPLDTTTGLNWCGYANERLRAAIGPVVHAFVERAHHLSS